MSEHLCVICGKPVRDDCRGRRRSTCGSRVCRGKASANLAHREGPGWPVVTGEVAADFSGQNVAARDGGFGFKIVSADRQSYAGCSAAYAAGVA